MLQTWMILFQEIQKQDANAAKLLLLLAHLDNRDIWYEFVNPAVIARIWLERTLSNGLTFQIVVKTLGFP
jgi:hypothetical protein